MASYGTLHTLDTLKSNFQSVAEYGLDGAYESVTALLAAHNAQVNEMLGDFVEVTTDKQRLYGTAASMEMIQTDEYGVPDAQKITAGADAGFPLKSFQGTLQWTRKFFESATMADLAAQVEAMFAADRRNLRNEIARALFNPTNYTTTEPLGNRLTVVPINVRALVNADSQPIPVGPNGETFNGATHTHYLAYASIAAADLAAALDTVLEHYNDGMAAIYINKAQEATVRAFTGFTALDYVQVTPSDSTARVLGTKLNAVRLYNRLIGYFNGAEVFVKPWIPAGYMFVFLRDQPKPLCMRVRRPGGGQLELVSDSERFPLQSRVYEREFGIGVWNRTNGAAVRTGNGTYAAPSIS